MSEHQFADSRALSTPFVHQLSMQAPALRSSNAILLAYTGNTAAIDWIDANIGSPVPGAWCAAAALLGTPRPHIAGWLQRGGPRGVAAADLPHLYLDPAPFQDATSTLERHVTVVGGMRHNLQNLLKGML